MSKEITEKSIKEEEQWTELVKKTLKEKNFSYKEYQKQNKISVEKIKEFGDILKREIEDAPKPPDMKKQVKEEKKK